MMGNKESVATGNLQRSHLKPSSSFFAQRHIVLVEHSQVVGQSSPLDGKQTFNGNLQSFEISNDENDNIDDSLFEEELVARGSSCVVSRNKPTISPRNSFRLPSNLAYEKDEIYDVQREPVSSEMLSTTAKSFRNNDNAKFEMEHKNSGKFKVEGSQTEANAAVVKVKNGGREHDAPSEINANRGKIPMNMQIDLDIVQNVKKWDLSSKRIPTGRVNGSISNNHKSISRDKSSNENVSPFTRMYAPPGNANCQFPLSQSQVGVIDSQCNGAEYHKGFFMTEPQSVESSGFSIQYESEKQSLDDDSEIFSSQTQHHCFFIQKEQKEFSECTAPDNGYSSMNINRASYISAITDCSDNACVSETNSKREPVESDDSVVPDSGGFRPHYSPENPVSQTETFTYSFGSNDIDVERFQNCFSFCMKGKQTLEKPFGSPNPSMTSVGVDSLRTSHPYSQTFHNDTGQFDVHMESPNMSHSSVFSPESPSGQWVSASLSEPSGENSETVSLPHSDTLKLKFAALSHDSVSSQSLSISSLCRKKSQDLNNQNFEPTLPEQDAKITRSHSTEMSNRTEETMNAAVKSGSDKSRTEDSAIDHVPLICKKENSACPIPKTAIKNHPTVFPRASLPSNANTPSSTSYHPKLDLDENQAFVTSMSCDSMDSNGNVRMKTPDADDFGRRNVEDDSDNNKRSDVPNCHTDMQSQHGQWPMTQSRQPEEDDADLLVDDHVAMAREEEFARRYGFHVPLDDPDGEASAFLRPVSDILSVSDKPGNPYYYDAYLLVADSDIEGFGLPFLFELESWGLRIFFKNRDLLLSGYEYENLSVIVEDRCNGKVIVVVSKNYPHSLQCQYLTFFAKNLDPDAQRRNIIPVYIDKEIQGLPRVLKGLAIIRYNQVYRRGWLKEKIMGALKA